MQRPQDWNSKNQPAISDHAQTWIPQSFDSVQPFLHNRRPPPGFGTLQNRPFGSSDSSRSSTSTSDENSPLLDVTGILDNLGLTDDVEMPSAVVSPVTDFSIIDFEFRPRFQDVTSLSPTISTATNERVFTWTKTGLPTSEFPKLGMQNFNTGQSNPGFSGTFATDDYVELCKDTALFESHVRPRFYSNNENLMTQNSETQQGSMIYKKSEANSYGPLTNPFITIKTATQSPGTDLSLMNNTGNSSSGSSGTVSRSTLTLGEKNGGSISLDNDWGYWRPKGSTDYVTYPSLPAQYMHRESIFYIASKQPHSSISIPNFRVRVVSSNGDHMSVRLGRDRGKPLVRIMCSFWPDHEDIYEVRVYLDGVNEEIDGSPFPIDISPDPSIFYDELLYTSSIRPTTSLNSFSGAKYKFWALAYNSGTKEVFVADRHGGQILIFSIQNQELALKKTWEWPTAVVPSQAFHPTGLALDQVHQRLYVTDKGNHTVLILSVNGDFIDKFGKSGYQDGDFSYPWGITVSPDGEYVAVADSKNHRVQLFTAKGKFLRKYSVFESNPYSFRKFFDQPRGITFDSTGSRLLVTDFNLGMTFDLDHGLTSQDHFGSAALTARPQGITVDQQTGTFLICDSRRNLIRRVGPTGDILQTIDRQCGPDYGVEMPLYACACDDLVCVVDRGGMRIRLLK